jgi:hypothetical protein
VVYKTLMREVMTYASTTWEQARTLTSSNYRACRKEYPVPLERNLDRCTQVHELHVSFKILYVYNYMYKLCRTQTEVILNHANPNTRGTGQGEAGLWKYKMLNLGGCRAVKVLNDEYFARL